MISKPEGYPLVYWASIAGAVILLAIDLFMRRDQAWATIGTFVLITVATFTRPGGLMKRR